MKSAECRDGGETHHYRWGEGSVTRTTMSSFHFRSVRQRRATGGKRVDDGGTFFKGTIG